MFHNENFGCIIILRRQNNCYSVLVPMVISYYMGGCLSLSNIQHYYKLHHLDLRIFLKSKLDSTKAVICSFK